MFDHPHSRMISGLAPKPFIPRQPQPVPILPEDGDAGENAHALVDSLINTPQPTSPRDAFLILFAELNREMKSNMDLIGALESFRQQFVARIQSQRSQARARLEDEHASCYQACRIVFDQAGKLRDRLNSADAMINIIDQRLGAARVASKAEEGKKPGPYPRHPELLAWRGDCDRVKALQTAIEEEREAAVVAGREVASALRAALSELAELQAQEQALDAQLKGRSAKGPYGIISPPQPVSELE